MAISLTRLMICPRRCLSRPVRAKSFGNTPLSEGLSRSMALMASSTSVPMVGCGALAFRCVHRASLGTQKMLAALYSSGSSGSAPCAFCATSSSCFASKASEMYLRKMRPRTTCLYSAASMLLRNASAACQSFCSKPTVAPFCSFLVFVGVWLAICRPVEIPFIFNSQNSQPLD